MFDLVIRNGFFKSLISSEMWEIKFWKFQITRWDWITIKSNVIYRSVILRMTTYVKNVLLMRLDTEYFRNRRVKNYSLILGTYNM